MGCNLKAAVTVACRYEPELNPTYANWAAHYGTAVLPARPYKPKNKAKVEVGGFLTWALDIGPRTRDVVTHLLERRPHPEHGYRSCLGLLHLAKRFGPTRLEAACERALQIGAPTRKVVLSILDKGLDRTPLPSPEPQSAHPRPAHDNVRGPDYYH